MPGEINYLYINPETTFGTMQTVRQFISDYSSVEIDPPSDSLLFFNGGSNLGPSLVAPGPYRVTGQFSVPVTQGVLAQLFRAICGMYETSGADVGGGGGSTLNGAVAKGATTAILNDASGYAIGEYIQIGAPDPSDNWEVAKIANIVTNTLTLTAPLRFAHDDGAACNEVEAPFAHSFAPSQARLRPTFSLRIGVDENIERRIYGCAATSLTLNNDRGFWMATCEFTAKIDTHVTFVTGPKAHDLDIYHYIDTDIIRDPSGGNINISNKVLSSTITLNYGIDADNAVRMTSRFPVEARRSGNMEFTQEMVLANDVAKQYIEMFWGGTGALESVPAGVHWRTQVYHPVNGADDRFELNIPLGLIQSHGMPMNERDPIDQTLTLVGLVDETGNAKTHVQPWMSIDDAAFYNLEEV